MRRGLTLAALLLPLTGCVVPPAPNYGYGYVQPGYPAPGYVDQGDYYPGYFYNDGAPYMIVEGAPMPLIFFGGSWGYYDGYRRFHRAPDSVWQHLESRHPHGSGVRLFEGRPEGPRPGDRPQGRPEWQQHQQPGGGTPPPPRQEYRQQSSPPVGPVPRAPEMRAPVQPRQEEHRGGGDHRCPPGQTRC
jgi:hypothetical protein